MFKPAEQTMTDNKPQFSVAELLKAAQLAGIDPASLPANANPWTLKGDSRAFAWQSAFRSINPAMAQEARQSSCRAWQRGGGELLAAGEQRSGR